MLNSYREQSFSVAVEHMNRIVKIDGLGIIEVQTISVGNGNLSQSGDQTYLHVGILQSHTVFRSCGTGRSPDLLNKNAGSTVTD